MRGLLALPMRNAFATVLLLGLCACHSAPDAYPPPAQYVMPSGPEPAAAELAFARPLLAMSDPDIRSHLLADVIAGPEGDEWRWTNAHPKFQVRLAAAEGLDFLMRFRVPRETLVASGPVTITIGLDGHVLDRPRFSSPDEHLYRRPVPPGVLAAGKPLVVALDVDPIWTSPDGTKLGILIHSLGFEASRK